MVQTFGKADVGKKGHVEYPVPKHCENSLQGTRWFANHGYDTTDLDMLPDETLFLAAQQFTVIPVNLIAGHLRNEHWEDPFRRDGFKDPKGVLHRGDLMREMNSNEIDRLVAHTWWHGRYRTYHIPHIESQLALAPQVKIQVLLEPKWSPVWLHQEVWNYLAAVCVKNHTHAAVYSLQHECLPYARHAGFNAWPING